MKYEIRMIIYPEGDKREIQHILRLNQLVDINGYPVRLPLQSVKTIVYRVYKKTTAENRNEDVTSYHLEQLFINELSELV
jgi:hypothetical protein